MHERGTTVSLSYTHQQDIDFCLSDRNQDIKCNEKAPIQEKGLNSKNSWPLIDEEGRCIELFIGLKAQ